MNRKSVYLSIALMFVFGTDSLLPSTRSFASASGSAACILLNPTDQSSHTHNELISFSSTFHSVSISGGTPYSQWSAVWLMELEADPSVLIDYDDAGGSPYLDGNGYYIHRAHNTISGTLSGSRQMSIGTHHARAKSQLTAEPSGGGSGVSALATSSATYYVIY